MEEQPNLLRHILALLLLCVQLTRGGDVCGCDVSCSSNLTIEHRVQSPVFYYSSTDRVCVQLTGGCSVLDNCVFHSQSACQQACDNLSGCEGEGCCPDGSARDKDGRCAGDTSEAQVPTHGRRWDLIATGMVVMLLLVAVLVISGFLTYTYKQRHKHRQRNRYIHEVLQMYDGTSDSLSDSSVEDNAESNNLFERL